VGESRAGRGGEQLPVGERRDRVRAFQAGHRVGHRLLEPSVAVPDQRCDQLRVGRRLDLDAVGSELGPELAGVDEVAVVAERDRPRPAVVDERLRIRPGARAGRGVAGVADRELAVEPAELLLREDLRDEAELSQDGQPAVLRHGDPRRLLAAVLQRVQAEVRQPRDITAGCPYSEDAAH
jgi:hypothetical protein